MAPNNNLKNLKELKKQKDSGARLNLQEKIYIERSHPVAKAKDPVGGKTQNIKKNRKIT